MVNLVTWGAPKGTKNQGVHRMRGADAVLGQLQEVLSCSPQDMLAPPHSVWLQALSRAKPCLVLLEEARASLCVQKGHAWWAVCVTPAH